MFHTLHKLDVRISIIRKLPHEVVASIFYFPKYSHALKLGGCHDINNYRYSFASTQQGDGQGYQLGSLASTQQSGCKDIINQFSLCREFILN